VRRRGIPWLTVAGAKIEGTIHGVRVAIDCDRCGLRYERFRTLDSGLADASETWRQLHPVCPKDVTTVVTTT
jgi:hypothetical protein